MKIPELLAPVGSMEHLKIAINAGASSVYLSGKNYGARKFAENFTLDEIRQATKIAHLHNVKVYVTVNTLIYEREIPKVLNYLNELYSIGIDAVLVQDLGLIDLINKYIPNLKIHASTQLTCENQLKLNYLESKRIKRVVLPREMRKEEIENLKTNMELEIFVHGAICYSYSGQCLMSSFKGGRSGNRGTCAQPCRQKYNLNSKEDYFLSPTDLCLFNQLKEIVDLNISCIKIEGRMRNKEYLAIVISSYRKALNKLKSNKKLETEELNLVFNRGFSEGHFNNDEHESVRPGHTGLKIGKVIDAKGSQIAIKIFNNIETIPQQGDGLLFIKKSNDYGLEISQNPSITTLNHYKKGKNKQIKDLTRPDKVLIIKKVKQNKKNAFNLNNSNVYLTKQNQISKKVKEIENKGSSFIKSKLILTFSIKNKYPLLKGRLTLLNRKEVEAEVMGRRKFEKPLKKSITQDMIKKQLLKVDNYPYDIKQVNINYDGTLFIPISEINRIRRKLFENLANELNILYKNKKVKIDYKPEKQEIVNNKIQLSYYTNNLNDLENIENVSRVYLDIPPKNGQSNINYLVNYLKDAILISQNKSYELIWKWPDIAHDNLIKKLNKVKGILNKLNYPIKIMNPDFTGSFAPYSMNITNSESANSLNNYELITLSPELNKRDLTEVVANYKNPEKLEIIVQGAIELMKTRYKLPANTTIDNYPIYENLSGEEFILLNDEEISLLSEISYLISIGLSNFAIDGRWKDKNYVKIIDIYQKAINGDINKKDLLKYSSSNTIGNY